MSSSSSSSSSTSSASLETSSLLRLNGSDLYSGLDTDSIIKKLTSGTRSKITAQKQLEQKAEWKRDEYRSIESMLEDFKNTYFSYTSDTNFLSASFFENTDITSSSDAVKATGSADDAANVTINDISQLASAASFSSTHKVSDEAITSGEIKEKWTASNVGGKSLTVNYGGTDYTLTMSYSVQPDSENTTTAEDGSTVVQNSEIQKVVDGLNDQIDSNSSIKGKISFKYNEDSNTISLSSTDSSLVVLKPYAEDSSDKSGEEFLKSLGFTGANQSGTSITGSTVDKHVDTSGLFNKTISSDSYINLNYDNKDYTVKLGANLDIYSASDSQIGSAIAKQINSQIKSDSSLSGLSGVTATASSDGTITFSSGVTVKGGSQNMMNGLFTSQTTDGTTTYTSKTPDSAALTESYLGDTLAGSTVTFNLNGIKKTITFDADDESSYSDASGLKTYLQGKLDSDFGSGTITVDTTDEGGLKFETADTNSVLELSASSDSTNVLSSSGALRLNVGETNRTETSKTLEELENEFTTTLEAGGDGQYVINVNGKDFSFTKDKTLGDVISTINDDGDAGVTISYSQTLNTFRVTADDTGSQGQVSISDGENGGNLAEVLFGTENTDYTIENGENLKMNVTLNGTTTDITRSSNNFTLDGLTLQVSNTYNYDSTTNQAADSSQKITFSSSNDTDDLYTNITDFVDAYNKIIKEIYTQVSESPERDSSHKIKYAPLTDDQKEDMSDSEITAWNEKAKKGLLQNDDALNNILTDMDAALSDVVSSVGMSLSQLGISTASTDVDSGPQLSVDTSTLKQVLAAEPDKVKELFTNTDGISQRVKKVLTKNISTSTADGEGVLILLAGKESFSNDQSEMTTQINSYESRIDDLNDQLETEEDRYWDQFTDMEIALSTLTAQSDYLTSMTGSSS